MTALDVRQDAALAILRVQGDYSEARTPGVTFDRWLYRRVLGILQDKYGTFHRRSHARLPHGIYPPDEEESSVERDSIGLDVRAAIATLDEPQRTVMTEVALNGRTQKDVAKQLGLTQVSVHHVYRAAKERLATALRAYGE